jgi:hypothetical protein
MAALDFPNAPVNGQQYIGNGLTYQYDGVKWVGVTGGDAPVDNYLYGRENAAWAKAVPMAGTWTLPGGSVANEIGGSTFKSELDIDSSHGGPTTTWLYMVSPTGGGGSTIESAVGTYKSGELPRWDVCLGDGTAETGANAGSNFAIYNYNDAGAFLGTPLSIIRATGTVSVTGTTGYPLQIFMPSGQYARTFYSVAGAKNWACGAWASGVFAISDETDGIVALTIGANGLATLNADPTAPLGAATKQYVDVRNAGGYVNKLRNGTFDVWQRGTNPGLGGPQPVYTADGWIVSWGGTAPAAVQQISRSGRSLYSLGISGAAGNTSVQITARIESYIAAALAGQTCTFQITIHNGEASTIQPVLSSSYPTTQDNFGTVTNDLGATNLQTVASNATVTVAYTFVVSANATNGYQISLSIAGGLPAGPWVYFSDADLRATPGFAVGLQANPPPPELRPISEELVFCQRYYESSVGLTTAVWSGNVTSGSTYYYTVPFKATKRIAPPTAGITLIYGNAGGFPAVVPTLNQSSPVGLIVQQTANSTLSGGFYQFGWSVSAEL